MTFSVERVRADFPLLNREVNGQPLAYLDSAASAQKPEAVINAEAEFYRHGYAAVHRGIHTLSAEATASMEQVRQRAATFLNARSAEELVFVRGTTEGINIVANSWGKQPTSARATTSSSARWSITPISCRGRCCAPEWGRSCG